MWSTFAVSFPNTVVVKAKPKVEEFISEGVQVSPHKSDEEP